ncbi:T9SS type A sorting domain-containing protein [bacterium]|nr:T9SS type A sorting domain-containing protein [bacterium]
MLPYNDRVNYGISFTPTSEGYKEATFQIYDGETRQPVEIALSGFALTSTDNPDSEVLPLINMLGNNYPNPFNPETTINYSVKTSGPVQLNIYNIKGQRVKKLVNDNKEAGRYSVVWDGKDGNNNAVASGLYLYKLESLGFTSSKKMILMK